VDRELVLVGSLEWEGGFEFLCTLVAAWFISGVLGIAWWNEIMRAHNDLSAVKRDYTRSQQFICGETRIRALASFSSLSC